MATEPPPPPTGPNWLWITLIALLAILLIVWLVNPSGDRDEAGIDDPIVMPDPAAPDAGPTGMGLPAPGETTGAAPAETGDPAMMPPAGEPIRGTTNNEPPPPPAQ